MAATSGTHNWKCIGHSVNPTLRHADNLRNHIACPLQNNSVANAHIFARNFIFIVQCGIGHNHAADGHRFEPRYRCKCACAPNLYINCFENRRRLLCRKLMRNGPARTARHKAKATLQRQVVHFVNHTVNIIAQRGTLRFDQPILRQKLFSRMAQHHQRIDGQAPGLESLHNFILSLRRKVWCFPPGIGKKFKRA